MYIFDQYMISYLSKYRVIDSKNLNYQFIDICNSRWVIYRYGSYGIALVSYFPYWTCLDHCCIVLVLLKFENEPPTLQEFTWHFRSFRKNWGHMSALDILIIYISFCRSIQTLWSSISTPLIMKDFYFHSKIVINFFKFFISNKSLLWFVKSLCDFNF